MNWKQKVLAAAGFAVLALPAYAQTGSSSTTSSTQGTSTTGTGSAQTQTGSTSTSSQTGAHDSMAARGENREAMLLGFIHHANQGEIEMANLAKENSSSKQVKDFADRVIKDHKSADDQVQAFAKSHNIDLAAARHPMSAMKEGSGSQSQAAGGTEEHARKAEDGMKAGMGHDGMKAGMGHDGMQAMAEHKATLDKLRTLKGAEFDREFARVMVMDHQKVVDRLTTARSQISDGDLASLVDKLLPVFKQHLSMAQKLQDSLSKS